MKFEFDISGLDDLKKNLNQLSKNAKNIDGKNDVPLKELFSNSFMQEHTKFDNFEAFIEKSKFNWENIENISDNELDSFVDENTSFTNWEEMLNSTRQNWTLNQLDL